MLRIPPVVKYTIDNTSSACFEYVGEDNHSKQSTYHLKCEHCGKIIHLSCNEIEEFENHISSHHNFKVDPAKTVFTAYAKIVQSNIKKEITDEAGSYKQEKENNYNAYSIFVYYIGGIFNCFCYQRGES